MAPERPPGPPTTWRARLSWIGQDWAANAGYPDSRLILVAFRTTQLVRTRWGLLGELVFAVYWVVVARLIGVELSPSTQIGPGLKLPHPVGVVVNPAARIGARCTLRHNVTIGNAARRDGTESGVPVLGDDVDLGTGCVIVGNVTVGDQARVAALSLVTRDVPPWGVVMGNPAHLVRIDVDERAAGSPGEPPVPPAVVAAVGTGDRGASG